MAAEVLDSIKPTGQDPQITTDDISAYVPSGLSPEQEVAYANQLQAKQPATGRLNVMDYYPTLNQPINVGNYSGSMIGSTTLFAPTAGLVPYGMFDAREKAIQQAAMAKAKEVEEFRKAFKAPTSKLVNINDKLREGYFNFIENSWQQNLKKFGGDANKALYAIKNDANFAAKEKSFQDLAKYGDAIVTKIAQDDEDIKTGRFTPTPTYKQYKDKLLTALDPNSKEFTNAGNYFRAMKVERDFADAFNDVTKQMVAQQKGYAGDINSDDFIKVYEGTIKEWSPEQKEAVITKMKDIYQGSDYFTPEKIDKDIKAMMSGKWETKKLDVKERREASDGAGYNYTENDISKEPSSTNVFTSMGQGNEPATGELVGLFGVTHKKPIPAIIPTGRSFFINDAKNGLIKTNQVSPNTEMSLVKTQLVKVVDASKFKGAKGEAAKRFLESDGTPLSEEQIASGNIPFRYEVASTGVMKDPDGEEVSFFIPADQVENSLVKKRDKSGKVTQGVPLHELYKERDKLNSSLKQQKPVEQKTQAASSQPVKSRKYKGLDKNGNPIFE